MLSNDRSLENCATVENGVVLPEQCSFWGFDIGC